MCFNHNQQINSLKITLWSWRHLAQNCHGWLANAFGRNVNCSGRIDQGESEHYFGSKTYVNKKLTCTAPHQSPKQQSISQQSSQDETRPRWSLAQGIHHVIKIQTCHQQRQQLEAAKQLESLNATFCGSNYLRCEIYEF